MDTDEQLSQVKNNAVLLNELFELLEKYDYRKEARRTVKFGFASKEEVQRKTNGDYFEFMK